jgi:hypothetical protein
MPPDPESCCRSTATKSIARMAGSTSRRGGLSFPHWRSSSKRGQLRLRLHGSLGNSIAPVVRRLDPTTYAGFPNVVARDSLPGKTGQKGPRFIPETLRAFNPAASSAAAGFCLRVLASALRTTATRRPHNLPCAESTSARCIAPSLTRRVHARSGRWIGHRS